MSIDFGQRARALAGARFRPQGRTSDGMDCVGVAMATFGIARDEVRCNYRLRGDHEDEARAFLEHHFERVGQEDLRSGDLMLLRLASDQLHFAVRTPAGFVHAHTRLRRVVETPGMPEWPVVAIYRKRRG